MKRERKTQTNKKKEQRTQSNQQKAATVYAFLHYTRNARKFFFFSISFNHVQILCAQKLNILRNLKKRKKNT